MESDSKVTVLAFGSAAELLGWPAREMEAAGPLSALIARLERECPEFVEARGRLKFAVNQAYATPETALCGGDEVAIIPPVAGG